MFSTLKTGRSLAASYNLQSDIQCELYFAMLAGFDRRLIFVSVFIQVQSDQEAALFSRQCSTIVALTKGCKSAKVVRHQADIPDGCGSAVVTPTILVHTLVRVSMGYFLPQPFQTFLLFFFFFRVLWILIRKSPSVRKN